MKPNFALNFTDDSIALLHRTKRGWTEIGSTPFAVDDLPAALAALRARALDLAPEGISTKLVIPNSQIKYLSIDAPGPDAAKRRAQIAAGLEGQTPYDVADLVWDHWGKGPTVQVAVLARETLEEAEGFAVANGFNPLSFVAIPADASYAAEPFFGPTAHAATVLKDGAKVDRDQDPIRILAAEPEKTPEPPQPEVQPEPAAPEEEPQPDLPETTPLPDTEPVQVPPPAPEVVPEPEPANVPDPGHDPEPAPEPLPIPEPDPAPPADPVEIPQDLPAYDPVTEPLTAVLDAAARPEHPLSEATVDPARIAATLSAEDPPAAVETAGMAKAAVLDPAIPEMDEAPMAIDVDDTADSAAPPRASVLVDPTVADDLPPLPSGAALAAFNARKSGDGTAPRIGQPAPRPVAPVAERPAGLAKTDRPVAARPAPKFGYETPGAKQAKPQGTGAKALRGLGALVTAPTIPGSRKARVAATGAATAAVTAATTAAGAAAAAATTGTTARRPAGLGSRPMPTRGKPRHLGLILTGLLLIMLALAAGLSTFYVSQSDTDPVTDTAAADLPAPEDEMLADIGTDQPESETLPADGVLMQAEDPNAAPPATGADAETASAASPAAAPAAALPAASPAPEAAGQDEIFLAATDTAPEPVDAAALPLPAARADPLPQASPAPLPFGTVYQFDENGLVRATPEGITTPAGVLLTAGRPARVPPPRPEAFAALAAAAAPAAPAGSDPATAPAGDPAVIIPADPALADARPLPRPAALAPAAAAPQDDGATLAPLADPRLAGLRPAPRPANAAEVAAAAGLTAPVVASSNGSLALVTPQGAVSPVGLTISRRPAARPEDMRRAIEEAVAAVARLPEPEAPADPDSAPEAEAEPEPEVASAAPRIPSTASVSKQATIKNAIDLRQVNLIGVYGTQSERYALVRNPNGRYVKVSVGDRLDGGRVAAITASELRYEKRGRMVVLELPNS